MHLPHCQAWPSGLADRQHCGSQPRGRGPQESRRSGHSAPRGDSATGDCIGRGRSHAGHRVQSIRRPRAAFASTSLRLRGMLLTISSVSHGFGSCMHQATPRAQCVPRAPASGRAVRKLYVPVNFMGPAWFALGSEAWTNGRLDRHQPENRSIGRLCMSGLNAGRAHFCMVDGQLGAGRDGYRRG